MNDAKFAFRPRCCVTSSCNFGDELVGRHVVVGGEFDSVLPEQVFQPDSDRSRR